MDALLKHMWLTIRLNFRSKQAMIYGYLVPVFFLIAFGSLFRNETPPLLHQMGRLLTITVLGGACFGMPTTMVNERERGLWRRYRLLPTATAGLIVSSMAARFVIVASAAVLQFVLGALLYHAPMPAHPFQLAIAFLIACFAFLGMGLVIAMLADTVPAVQALGQALFLPMIMIGGVGVPLVALPGWARIVSGFLPGRYAVEVLESCILPEEHGLATVRFGLLALVVIGGAACLAGAKLFRWDAGQKIPGKAKLWLLVALAAWIAIGTVAWMQGRSEVTFRDRTAAPVEKWKRVTDADLKSITYTDLPDDDGSVIPFAPDLKGLDGDKQKHLDAIRAKLAQWGPGKVDDLGQRVKNYMCVCSLFDIGRDENEANVPLVVMDQLKQSAPPDVLKQALGWVILHPAEGTILTSAPELGVQDKFEESEIRERSALYAKKFLKRLQ